MRADRLQSCGELFRLCAGDGFERRLVLLDIPDLPVISGFKPRPDGQDDTVENELPDRTLVLDHPRVREEFLKITAHARRIGGIWSAEIDQQHADLDGRDRWTGGRRYGLDRSGNGRGFVHDNSSSAAAYAIAARLACVLSTPST